jgi:S1-C subfamily serine protease
MRFLMVLVLGLIPSMGMLAQQDVGGGQAKATEWVVKVTHVSPGGPAARAGVRAGDIIYEIDGTRVRSSNAYLSALRRAAQQSGRATLTIFRNTQAIELEVNVCPDCKRIHLRYRMVPNGYGHGDGPESDG